MYLYNRNIVATTNHKNANSSSNYYVIMMVQKIFIEGGKSRKPWQQKWTRSPENPLYDSKEYLVDFQNPLTDDEEKGETASKVPVKGSRARKSTEIGPSTGAEESYLNQSAK